MNLLKKKYKVRIRSYGSGAFYCVEYTYYYVIPIWRYIHKWSGFPHNKVIFLDRRDAAEKFGMKFTSIEMVKEHEKHINNLLCKKNKETKIIISK